MKVSKNILKQTTTKANKLKPVWNSQKRKQPEPQKTMWNNPKQIWQPEQSQRMKRTEQRHATYNNLNQFFLFLKENLRTHWTTCNNLKHCSADWGATKTAKEQVVTSSNSNTTTAEDNLEKLKQVKQQKIALQ